MLLNQPNHRPTEIYAHYPEILLEPLILEISRRHIINHKLILSWQLSRTPSQDRYGVELLKSPLPNGRGLDSTKKFWHIKD